MRNTDTYEISEKGVSNFKFKTWLGKKEFVNATTKEDIYVTINKKSVKNFKVSLKYSGPITAPIKKGDKIGNLIVQESEEEIRSIPLYANEDVEKVNLFKSLFLSFNYMIWGDV